MASGSGPADDPSLSYALRVADLLAAGDPRSALAAASEACNDTPGRAESDHVHGQSWAAPGESDCTERAFAEAVRIRPERANAWVNHGVARHRRNAVDDAEAIMREALRREPGHTAASDDFGASLRITSQADASEAPCGRPSPPSIVTREAASTVLLQRADALSPRLICSLSGY